MYKSSAACEILKHACLHQIKTHDFLGPSNYDFNYFYLAFFVVQNPIGKLFIRSAVDQGMMHPHSLVPISCRLCCCSSKPEPVCLSSEPGMHGDFGHCGLLMPLKPNVLLFGAFCFIISSTRQPPSRIVHGSHMFQ